MERFELSGSYDFTEAFKSAKRKKADAVFLLFSPMFGQQRVRIAAIALENKMPTMHQDGGPVAVGGLMSYGPSLKDTFQRSGYYVDRLLKGAKAADLPMEQAAEFKLIVNLKTAKALGIPIPQSILQRADEVIQ